MLRVLACVTQEHNPWLLVLAALICAIASVGAFLMLSRAGERGALIGRAWAIAAGLTAGLGVWATHFVAMTAYDVGVPLGFALAPLFGSLAISMTAQCGAFWLAYQASDARGWSLAGAAAGVGVIVMHYVGMTGIETPALLRWDTGLVVASVTMSVLFAAAAFVIYFASEPRWRALCAGGALVVAICALHFTAMGALTMIPLGAGAAPQGLSQAMLGVVVGFGALLSVIAALAAAMADAYLSDRQRIENLRLRGMVDTRTAELQALAQEQSALAARAEAANTAKSQFLANISHELRTPLNAIIGYGEMLAEDAADPGAQKDAQRVVAAGQHLLALINDILDLSKIDAGRVELERAPFDAAALAADALDTVRPAAVAGGTALRMDLAVDLGLGEGDVFKLKQCLLNLLANAVKFAAGGTVVLEGRRERSGGEDWLVFVVRDTGIGMSEEQMARLFQPFVQADASMTRKYGGSGLGLAITRRLAQVMGGDVSVQSAPGQGAVFTLRVRARLSTEDLRAAA